MDEPGQTETDLTEPGPAEPDTLRLFFALWPDDATRDALNRAGKLLHQHWGGRLMRADTLHITLAFLGSTPAAQLDALVACADSVGTDAFELILDQAGYWRHNRIGWLGASQTPAQHLELVGALNAALQGVGFAVDARPHVPHVTLLRNSAGGEVPECAPVHWPISDFVLVASRREAVGMHYDVIRRWPLA
ncbi:MAG: RNA 2',3'-cyclic phosphodiesterase [Thiobacillus sp.]|nr:RNA 2',3'-cyclic phosphodiesterase [Thiobacillus sp.]